MTVYELITAQVVAKLQAGVVPWHKPWKTTSSAPRNLISGKPYRGINAFLLAMQDCASPFFLTFKQALERGGCVRKGSRGYPVVFWKFPRPETDAAGEAQPSETKGRAPLLRYYTVFNVSQCDGLRDVPAPDAPAFAPIATCEAIVASMPGRPDVEHGGDRAYYRPSTDAVRMPSREAFENAEAYYSTLFHELTHSTGHASRLSRPGITDAIMFGSHAYSREELVAEMGAAFLCGHAGISPATLDGTAAYIASWLAELQHDQRLLVLAAAQAQKAADHVLGVGPAQIHEEAA